MVVIWEHFAIITEPGEFWSWTSGDKSIKPDCVALPNLSVIGFHLELRFKLRLEHTTNILVTWCTGRVSVNGKK